ncbi:MAG: hypothetical protein H6737_24715 [Alphaproteobacteria bacterium]|nr:hypothetical protein [Alphaproteobacteria bacterium]
MLILMLACGQPTPPPDPVPPAIEAARKAVARSGWEPAVGAFTVERVAHAPREGDRAIQILADATLAWFDAGDRKLVVTDAAIEGPRWRGEADADAEALVRTCPDAMLGPHDLTALVVHELGHAALLSDDLGLRFANLERWSALAGWEQAVGRDRNEPWPNPTWKPATVYRGPTLLREYPELAQRLCRGEPRGDGAYRTSRDDFPTPYARVDPLEDMAESFRLYHADPAALAALSPPKYLALATPSAWGGTAVETRLEVDAIRPGLEALLRDAPWVAMEALRSHGPQLAPHIGHLARPPFVWPDGVEGFDLAPWHVTLGDMVFRPDDAFFADRLAAMEAEEKSRAELQEAIDALRAWAEEAPEVPE